LGLGSVYNHAPAAFVNVKPVSEANGIDVIYVATQDIVPGAEMFVTYGDAYWNARTDALVELTPSGAVHATPFPCMPPFPGQETPSGTVVRDRIPALVIPAGIDVGRYLTFFLRFPPALHGAGECRLRGAVPRSPSTPPPPPRPPPPPQGSYLSLVSRGSSRERGAAYRTPA